MTAAVFLALAVAGALTASPAVNFGDSGELVAAAAAWGVPHAPGYPAYVLLARAFGLLLPLGTWAWRLNVFSSVCSAGAAALVFDAARRRGASPAAALAGAATLAFAPRWLEVAAQAEVFALNSLLGAALLHLCLCAGEGAFSERRAAAAGLLLGFGTGNHHTLALGVPALAAAALLARGAGRTALARSAAAFAAFLALGASVQLVLPLRAAASPPLDWGHPVDVPRWLRVLLRRDYGSFALTVDGRTGPGSAAQLLRFLRACATGLGPAACGAAALGAARLAVSPGRRRDGLLLLVWLVMTGPFFLVLGNPPADVQTSYALERFWLLPWLAAALAAAEGVELLLRWPFPGRAAALVVALAPLARAWASAPDWTMRWDLAAHDHGRNILRAVPPGGALVLDGGDDNFYTTAAALYADGLRPDVLPVDRGGLVFRGVYGPDFRALPKESKEDRRVAVEDALARERPTLYGTLRRSIVPGRRLAQAGLLRASLPGPDAGLARSPQDGALWEATVLRRDPRHERARFRDRALVAFYPVMRAASDELGGRPGEALRALRLTLAEAADVPWVPAAVAESAQWIGYAALGSGDAALGERAYGLACAAEPGRSSFWTNRGAARERLGDAAGARGAYERAMALSPADAQPVFNMGVLSFKAGDYRAAAGLFSKAAALDPGNPESAVWARRAAELAGRARR